MAILESLKRTPTLEVSSGQDLVIPASVLEDLGFKPGQKFVALSFQGSIRLIPLVSHEEAFGSMPGLDSIVDPEDEEHQ